VPFEKMFSYEHYNEYNVGFIRRLIKLIGRRKIRIRLELLCLTIGICIIFNMLFIPHFFQRSLPSELQQLRINSKSKNFNSDFITTIERSTRALNKLKQLLASVASPNDQPWIWTPTKQYPSVPYQPTSLLNQSIPKSLYKITNLPQPVTNEVDRVCKRLNQANKIGGEIWCKLFKKCYTDTLATTTTILDDNSTYIITGDIDLMWLRDSR
jgi:hypothetical protein